MEKSLKCIKCEDSWIDLLGFYFKKTLSHKNNPNKYEEGNGQDVKASSGNGSHFRKTKKKRCHKISR